MLQKGIIQHS
jgi:hypothetical protein